MAIARFFPAMFLPFINKEGKELFPVPKTEEFVAQDFPHWSVFLSIHQGSPFDDNVISKNAEIISKIPESEIKEMTWRDLLDKGVDIYPSDRLD